MKCKDCKYYSKDCFGHSGYCQLKDKENKENGTGYNTLVGCNRTACDKFEKK